MSDELIESTPIYGDGAEWFAFGTFDIVADTNPQNYELYLNSKFKINNTKNDDNEETFLTILNKLINGNSTLSSFDAVAVTITESIPNVATKLVDDFKNVALDITYGLYGFIGFCIILAIIGKIHASCIGADNVRVMGIVYFGIWTWDFMYV